MALTKYVAQNVPERVGRAYLSEELRKIQRALDSIGTEFTTLREELADNFANVQADIADLDDRITTLEPVVNTWTPFVFGGTVAGVGTYTLQDGFYIKQGRMVFTQARIRWTAHTGTGVMKVGGLPFVSAPNFGSNANYWTASVYSDSDARMILLYPNSTISDLYNMPSPIAQTNMVASCTLIYSQYYYTT